MSELRDLTAALRAQSKRLDSFGDALVLLLRDSGQQSEWRHEQRNAEQMRQLEQKDLHDSLETLQKSITQVGNFQSALWEYLGKLDERLETLAQVRHDDVRALSDRVRALEPQEEVTKA
jgi:hypothetical protein